MSLYSHNGSYPDILPFRIVLSNGNTRTDPDSFTDEEISDAGYILVDEAPAVTNTQTLEWNSESISWAIRDKTEEEIALEDSKRWEYVRSKRDELLSETDYVVLKAYETNTAIEQRYLEYRQKLRDIPQDYNNIEDIVWPILFPEEHYL